jgi:aspartate aminotransferase
VVTPIDAKSLFLDPAVADASHSTMARGLQGSSILKVAAEIRAMQAAGKDVCNLTVGDFDPKQFPVPPELVSATTAALQAGHTNYPPSDGVPELRKAVQRYYRDELRLDYPLESVLIASGARPILYGAYGVVLDPGETVVFPVPSWNNMYYAHLFGARAVTVPVTRETGFHPTAADLRPHLREARLLVVNSPQNPTGTVIDPEQLRELTQCVVDENRRRAADGRKALFLLYDQVYWTLTYGGRKHVTPVELVPESAPYVIMLDAISKSFAATGMRVGWAVASPAVIARMRDFLGHVGAWAPRAEQVATAQWLDAVEARHAWENGFRDRLRQRLDALYAGFCAMAKDGLPVEAIEPQGAIYLSVRFRMVGSRFADNEAIRKHLLAAAGMAVVPFQAFGLPDESGWFRLSVGAVSMADIERMLPRLREALR